MMILPLSGGVYHFSFLISLSILLAINIPDINSLHATLYMIIKEMWRQSYKTFFMLNSTEHKISTAHKTKTLKKMGISYF